MPPEVLIAPEWSSTARRPTAFMVEPPASPLPLPYGGIAAQRTLLLYRGHNYSYLGGLPAARVSRARATAPVAGR